MNINKTIRTCILTLSAITVILAGLSSCSDNGYYDLKYPHSSKLPDLPEVGDIHTYKAPLYWTIYEHALVTDREGISKEDADFTVEQWAEVMDWIKAELLPYGYDMICTDGWSVMTAQEGSPYMTHLTTVPIKELVKMAKDRGLRVGIYDNPMWIHCDDDVKIPGTEYTAGSLLYDKHTDAVEHPKASDKWHKWGLATHPGAKEWIDGFFKHYSDLGVDMIRIDYLSWYEDGTGRIDGITGRGYGRANYALCLGYIAEAAKKYGIFTSLVMPHMFNDGELETKYGNMVRIVCDTWDGGWDFTSTQHRGLSYGNWPNCENQFDGFTFWNHITGKGRIIPDGDFTRLNTYETDEEKETTISLQLMAGGPIAVADRPSTMGDNLRFYTNDEILALNKDRFVGRPLDTMLDSEGSRIWHGEMSNGDYIVALFNREDSPAGFKIDLKTFGLDGPMKVRDLWKHIDEGEASVLEATVAAHGCKVMRLSK